MAKKVLIADDEEMIREAVRLGLKKEGYEIYEAEDGLEALSIARNIKPDVIIIDVMMPGKVGYQVCKELRQDPDAKDTYVIFLTARGKFARVAVQDVGGNELITKPFDIKHLRQRVRNAMEGKAETAPSEEKEIQPEVEVKAAKKILIAGDDDDIRTATKILLKSGECQVFEAASGFEAYEMAKRIGPDLIILDLAMIGGIDSVPKELIEDPRLKDIYTIFLNTGSDADSEQIVDTYDGDTFCIMPFEIEQLKRKVNEVLGN